MPVFWIFWRESFTARKKRLAARGSRLRLAGSQNSLPPNKELHFEQKLTNISYAQNKPVAAFLLPYSLFFSSSSSEVNNPSVTKRQTLAEFIYETENRLRRETHHKTENSSNVNPVCDKFPVSIYRSNFPGKTDEKAGRETRQ